jgi:uncharacterized protein (TIGR02444 family)
MDFPPSQLWSFSLDIYRRPGVAEACLALQDRHGLDVNLLLAALYAGRAGIALDADAWALLEGAVGAYHRDVVRPLRAARRALKPLEADPAPQLRSAVKAAELDAEHLEQLMIEAALAGFPGGGDPRGNAMAYLASLGVAADTADQAAIDRLAAAIPSSG